MIATKFNTLIIRKDVLAAKWPDGIEGFKATIAFNDEWHQEDDHLIAFDYSMGSDLALRMAFVIDRGITVLDKHTVVNTHPTGFSRLAQSFLGKRIALRLFGRKVEETHEFFAEAAVAGFGMPTRRCAWLKPVPGKPGYVHYVAPTDETAPQ
jgi:hypothetical protein